MQKTTTNWRKTRNKAFWGGDEWINRRKALGAICYRGLYILAVCFGAIIASGLLRGVSSMGLYLCFLRGATGYLSIFKVYLRPSPGSRASSLGLQVYHRC
jgi:hypothetical protein